MVSQVRFGEAQPLVGVELSGFFKSMFDQVEDDDAAAGDQDSGRLLDGAIGVQGVVERLREDGQVDGVVVDGNLFHVAEAVFDVADAMAEGLLAGDFDHFGTGVDGDDSFGTLGEQQRECSLAGAKVGDYRGRHEAEQGFGDALPGLCRGRNPCRGGRRRSRKRCASCLFFF